MSTRSFIQAKVVGMLVKYGAVTRPECISELGVRAATLLEVIDSLKGEGLISEPLRQGKRTGRRSPLITFEPNYFWTIGIQLLEDVVYGVVIDMTGKVLYQSEIRGGLRDTEEECLHDIFAVMDELRTSCGSDWSRVAGICFADPGLVDLDREHSLRAVNLPGWREISTKAILEKRYSLRTLVVQDAVPATYLEAMSYGRDLKGSIFRISFGNGIGAGFIKNGECFIGDTNLAMEVGHIVVKPDGPLCQCGNRGCLEAIAGRNGILRRVQETIQSGVNTELRLEDFSIKKFAKSAHQDKAAMMIASEVCDTIGRALSTVVTLLNPTYIVLSGDLTDLGDFLLDNLRRIMTTNCLPRAMDQVHLEISKLQPIDVPRGAALLLRNAILREQFPL